MSVGRFDRKEDYVKEKVAEYNQIDAGIGGNWKQKRIGDRNSLFETNFE